MISEELSTQIADTASAALLRIAQTYHAQGLLHQAASPYLKIVCYYPKSEATPAAVEGLITIAQIMEDHHQRRMALAIYDRLEQAARFQRWDGHSISPDGEIV